MNIILLTHNPDIGSASMPRFAAMLAEGMRSRGHSVTVLSPTSFLRRYMKRFKALSKWGGYIDDLVIFPLRLKLRYGNAERSLFVFADQALCVWLLFFNTPRHIVHCHDFLALRSALGEFPRNRVGFTGRCYQMLIRRGVSKALNFISISAATQKDLLAYTDVKPKISEVIYNGLNFAYRPVHADEAKHAIGRVVDADISYILHVGGNSWYKNRAGVIKIYAMLCGMLALPPALVMLGADPSSELKAIAATVPKNGTVKFVSGATAEELRAAYSLAEILLFPSLEEGFGWPIAEAMACGCPVVTTGRPPMTEVGGSAAEYIDRRPEAENDDAVWADRSAQVLKTILSETTECRNERISKGINHAARFDTRLVIEGYERLYANVMSQ